MDWMTPRLNGIEGGRAVPADPGLDGGYPPPAPAQAVGPDLKRRDPAGEPA